MIAIVNVGPIKGETNPLGEHRYQVRINQQVVTTFTHHRANGLAQCLLLAAEAVKKKRGEDLMRLLEEFNGPAQV